MVFWTIFSICCSVKIFLYIGDVAAFFIFLVGRTAAFIVFGYCLTSYTFTVGDGTFICSILMLSCIF